MSDCEETHFLWESWTSPGKRKRKKDSKKDKKRQKCKNDITMKTDENILKKKKKKNPKFKEAMESRKAKKKEKKKKKDRLALELHDSFVFTQASGAEEKPARKPETLNPHSNEKIKPEYLTEDSKKATKRKKKVAFDLSPGYICVKHPNVVSSFLHCPKESILLENETMRDSENCSQVTVTEHDLGSTHDNDSQCTSEDINSQDLFITQKTFRASPPEPSSGETSDKAVTTTPQTLRDRLRPSVAQIKEHLEGSNKCSQDSLFPQHHRKTSEHEKEPVQVVVIEEEEEGEGLNKTHHDNNKGKLSFQTQMEQTTNLTKERKVKVMSPLHINPDVMNPFLAKPIVVNPSLDVAMTRKCSCTSSKLSMTSTSTQTENLFTTELSSYLSFCQKTQTATHFGDLKALDLSLPQRERKDLGTCLSVKTSIKSDPNLLPSCSSDMKNEEENKVPCGRHPGSVSTRGKGETTHSPQSESESKSTDTTTSSEDIEPHCRAGKLDLTQVKAVQMRLNESFFFKTKGDGQSPRPESPLMKLAQGRNVKSRKGR